MPAQFPPPTNTPLSGPTGPLPAAFSRVLLRQLLATRVDDTTMTDARRLAQWESARQALLSFEPADPMEAMLAAQAVAAHGAATDCLRQAAQRASATPADPRTTRLHANAADLMQSYQAVLRQLERHRGWATSKRPYRL